MKTMKHKSILAAAACCCALVASAAERTWDGGGADDLMSTRENWSGDTTPGSSDTAIVHANAAKPAVVPAGETQYSILVIGGHGSTAQTHDEGFIIQTNGTLTVSGNDGLRIGRLDNCPGTYIISNGTLKATTGSAFVGIHGSTGKLAIAGDGKVVVSSTAANTGLMLASPGPTQLATTGKTSGYIEISENGILSVANLLNVGNASGGKGYYGEVKQTGGKVYIGTLQIAAQGSGHKYIQSGGTNAVNRLHIGGGASTSGTYDLDGGLLSVTNLFHVGNNGAGTLNISGTGEVESACELVIGAGSGAGTITMNGGKIVAKNELQVGKDSAGTLRIDGGAVTIAKHLKIGNTSGKTGTIKQTGGSVKMGKDTSSTTFPYIGYAAGSTGVYEISGGTFETTNTGFFVGGYGTGVLDISGSAVFTVKGNVNMCCYNTGKGTLKLRDGGRLVANHVKKHNGTAELVEFDGGILQARQPDEILKNLPNIQLKSGGLTLATETYNQTVRNCTFNVTDGGSITVTGSGKVTFSGCTLKFNNRPSGAKYVFAEVADGSDATLEGLPTLAGDVCGAWRLKLSEDKKKILAVPPGLIIIFR